MKKICVILTLVLVLNLGAGLAIPAKGSAELGILDILGAAANYAAVRKMYTETEYNRQDQVYRELKKKYGVSGDRPASLMLHRIFTRLEASPANNEIAARPPKYFVSPDGEINAFRSIGNVICVFEGVFAEFDYNEDMVAFVVAHECGHGTKQHVMRKMEGMVPLILAANLYAKGMELEQAYANILGTVLTHIQNDGYSVPFEWEADNSGFDYAVNAGYNPGAAAAGEFRMRVYYNEKDPDLYNRLFNPSTHPTSAKRVENFSRRLTEFSGNTVSVAGTTVNVRGQAFLIAQQLGGRLAEERAFLIAGNLARVFHQTPGPTEGAVVEYGAVRLAGRTIVNPGPAEPSAEELRDKLNQILGLTTPDAAALPDAAPKPPAAGWTSL